MSTFLIFTTKGTKDQEIFFTNDPSMLESTLTEIAMPDPKLGEAQDARRWASEARPGDRFHWSRGVIVAMSGQIDLSGFMRENP